MEAPRGAREPTGTNGPTLNNHPNQRSGEQQTAKQLTAATTIQTTINPHPPPHKQAKRGNSVEHIVLWWSQHRGNAQHTFRTWKLSPAAPMVLQPIGRGRVGHRHNTPKQERPRNLKVSGRSPLIHTPGPRHRGIHPPAHNSTSPHHETQHTNGPTSPTFALVTWDA